MKKKTVKTIWILFRKRIRKLNMKQMRTVLLPSLSNGKDFIIKSHKSCSDARESVISGLMSLEALYGMRSTGKGLVHQISKELEQQFPKMGKPVPRLIKYLEILHDNHLIYWKGEKHK